jgi:hypothetical protein
MNRHHIPQFARVLTVVTISVVALGAAPDPVHPPGGGNLNAPIQIALLADHYTLPQKDEFKYDVENFITYGLMQDPYYQSQGSKMRIVSYFDETPAGKDSRFGFEIGTGDGTCAVKAPGDILTQLSAAVNPDLPTHFIVIANHPYNIGCTVANWTYVAVGAAGTDVLQHELGHLVGKLYDEWSLAANRQSPHPGLVNNTLNCGDSATPYWMSNPTAFPGAKAVLECDLWGQGVYHAYDACRMGAMNHKQFCLVCKAVMDKAFTFVSTAPPSDDQPPLQASHEPTAPRFRIMNASFGTNTVEQPGATPNSRRSIMRLIVDFDPGSVTPKPRPVSMTIRKTIFASGIYIPNSRRVGQFAYEVTERTGLKEVGVIPDNMFQSRAYRGSAGHGSGTARPVQMFLDIPNEDLKTMSDTTRKMEITLWRIPKDVKEEMITKANWPSLRKVHNFEKLGNPIPVPIP